MTMARKNLFLWGATAIAGAVAYFIYQDSKKSPPVAAAAAATPAFPTSTPVPLTNKKNFNGENPNGFRIWRQRNGVWGQLGIVTDATAALYGVAGLSKAERDQTGGVSFYVLEALFGAVTPTLNVNRWNAVYTIWIPAPFNNDGTTNQSYQKIADHLPVEYATTIIMSALVSGYETEQFFVFADV